MPNYDEAIAAFAEARDEMSGAIDDIVEMMKQPFLSEDTRDSLGELIKGFCDDLDVLQWHTKPEFRQLDKNQVEIYMSSYLTLCKQLVRPVVDTLIPGVRLLVNTPETLDTFIREVGSTIEKMQIAALADPAFAAWAESVEAIFNP